MSAKNGLDAAGFSLDAQPGFNETAMAFQLLAERVYGGTSFEDLQDAVCRAAVDLVPGCDHASILRRDGTRIYSASASDEIASHVDALEVSLGEGPCVDTLLDEAAHIEPNLTTCTPWPRFAAAVVTQTPVRGAAGFRIVIDGRKQGALNVFCDTPDRIDATSVNQAAVLAAFASIGLQAAAHRESAASLLDGLHNNREIGKAVGLMMAFHKVSDADAFELLRKSSQDLNVKVLDIARELVGHHNSGARSSSGH